MNVIRKVLVPFNFSKEANNALDYAISFIGDEYEIKLDLICVVAEDEEQVEITKMESRFQNFIDKSKDSTKIKINYTVERGDLIKNVLAFQEEHDIDIIFMGTGGEHHLTDEGVTNTSELVIKAECPVIVVPEVFKEFHVENITLAVGNNELDDPKALSTLLAVARKFNANIHVLTIYKEEEDYLADNKNESILKYYLDRFYRQSSFAVSKNIADSIIAYEKKEEIDMLAIIPRNHATRTKPSEGKLTKWLSIKTDIPLLTID